MAGSHSDTIHGLRVTSGDRKAVLRRANDSTCHIRDQGDGTSPSLLHSQEPWKCASPTGAAMLAELIPGLRNLRSGFLSGSLILGSLYVLFADVIRHSIKPEPPLLSIVHLATWMPLALLGSACFLVGSLYVTGLEGVVDWIHRKRLLKDPQNVRFVLRRRFLLSLAPLSSAAQRRLVVEAGRFYNEFLPPPSQTADGAAYSAAQRDFTNRVLADVLWMEGKLAGTSLQGPYDQYRAEGELRLGTSLIMPVVTIAAGDALRLSLWNLLLVLLLVVLLSIKLAGYGLYYFRRAHSLVAHHIADGTVLTPSMETLKRTKNVQEHTHTGSP